VRFLNSGQIFQAARALCERAIASHGAAAYVAQAAPAASLASGLGAFAAPGSRPLDDVPLEWPASGAPAPAGFGASGVGGAAAFGASGGGGAPAGFGRVPAAYEAPFQRSLPLQASEPAVSGGPGALAAGLAPGRYVGALFNTYLTYDLGAELALVDQHAAHERIRYEALRARVVGGARVASQELLIPEAVHVEDASHEEIERRLPWLEKLGFAAELFGEGAVLFRAIPADWGSHELKTRLKNLLERALAEPMPSAGLLLDERLFEKLASEACHSSVRAGDRLEREEALALVSRLFATDHPWNCPHGRPTVVRIPRAKLEEWFLRRI
jgi:DNA mismatch repair protein MutL